MEYKTLGDTGLLVSTLCLGTMTFHGGTGRFKVVGTVDQAGADELIKTSVDAGINFFDTADVYSEGESEKMLGQSLKNLGIARKDVVLATKVFARVGPSRNDVGASRGHIMDAVETSLRRLQTDHIDLYQIHGNDSVTPLEETLRALDALVTQGKVRYIGCSNWQAWKIAKALGISELKNLARLDTLQAYYSIAGRDLERELVPFLEAEKIGLLVWSPLAGCLNFGGFELFSSIQYQSARAAPPRLHTLFQDLEHRHAARWIKAQPKGQYLPIMPRHQDSKPRSSQAFAGNGAFNLHINLRVVNVAHGHKVVAMGGSGIIEVHREGRRRLVGYARAVPFSHRFELIPFLDFTIEPILAWRPQTFRLVTARRGSFRRPTKPF